MPHPGLCVVPGASHQVALDLQYDGPVHFVLEPPGFLLHRWQPGEGMVTHQCAIGRFSGLWPFYDSQGLIDQDQINLNLVWCRWP